MSCRFCTDLRGLLFWQNNHPELFQIKGTGDVNFLFKDSGSGYWHIGQEVKLDFNPGSNYNQGKVPTTNFFGGRLWGTQSPTCKN